MSNTDVYSPNIINVLFKLNKIMKVSNDYKHEELEVIANNLKAGSILHIINIFKDLYGSNITIVEENNITAIIKINDNYIGINTNIIDDKVKILFGCYTTIENIKNWFSNSLLLDEEITDETEESLESTEEENDDDTEESIDTDISTESIDEENHNFDKYRYLMFSTKDKNMGKILFILNIIREKFTDIKIILHTINQVLFKTSNNMYICIHKMKNNNESSFYILIEKSIKTIIQLFELDYEVEINPPLYIPDNEIKDNTPKIDYKNEINELLNKIYD